MPDEVLKNCTWRSSFIPSRSFDLSKIALPNCEVGYKERKVKKISSSQVSRDGQGREERHHEAQP